MKKVRTVGMMILSMSIRFDEDIVPDSKYEQEIYFPRVIGFFLHVALDKLFDIDNIHMSLYIIIVSNNRVDILAVLGKPASNWSWEAELGTLPRRFGQNISERFSQNKFGLPTSPLKSVWKLLGQGSY